MNKTKIWMRDLPKILRKIYDKSETPFPKKPRHSLVDLIEWVMRIPSHSQRNVYKSRELERKILTAFEIQNLNEIEKIVIRGGNLKPYLGDITRSIRNRHSKKNDLFASDWGLLHFHLGIDFKKKQTRVSRSKRILIARFEKDNAYFIDVVNHGRGYPHVWGETSHLEILYKNWPDVFSCIMSNLSDDRDISINQEISATDYIKLRNAGITTPITINGKVFFGRELGITADGSQEQAVDISLQINKELEKAEIEFRKKEPINKAFLVIKPNHSVGFLVPKKNKYYPMYRSFENNQIANFFMHILSEIPLSTNKVYSDFITPKRIKY